MQYTSRSGTWHLPSACAGERRHDGWHSSVLLPATRSTGMTGTSVRASASCNPARPPTQLLLHLCQKQDHYAADCLCASSTELSRCDAEGFRGPGNHASVFCSMASLALCASASWIAVSCSVTPPSLLRTQQRRYQSFAASKNATGQPPGRFLCCPPIVVAGRLMSNPGDPPACLLGRSREAHVPRDRVIRGRQRAAAALAV